MRITQLLQQTEREVSAAHETAGHQYLLRGGYVRPLAAGIFSYLHLGQRVLQRIKLLLREEMDRLGGEEISMPLIHPAALWRQSERWDDIDAELGRFRDRSGREMVLALSHEEVVATLAAQAVQSYRQLPRLVYQIQLKWRDDARPRAGLIRTREFTMLDSYSLDRDESGLDKQYQAHFTAYERIFARAGLPVISVEGDVGMMGGSLAHEFMYLTPIGEDTLLLCAQCGYRANRQVARFQKGKATADVRRWRMIAGGIGADQKAQERLVVAILPAEGQLNETKLSNLLGADWLRPAAEDELAAGMLSPLIVADDGVTDVTAARRGDIAAAQEGDRCIECGAALTAVRGVEVANIFKLGTHYSRRLGAGYVDEDDNARPIVMGSYGIGVTRLLACLAEHYHDERGLCWPTAVAPYDAHLLSLRGGAAAAARLYGRLQAAGLSVLFDDRAAGAGQKFHDADLLGMPWRLTVSARTAARDEVEVTRRETDETVMLAETAVIDYLRE